MKLKLGRNTLIKVFLCENFGKESLENFLLTLQKCSKHLKSLLSQSVCVSKTIVTIQHNKKYYSKTKQTKKNDFPQLYCNSRSFELIRIPIDFLKIWSQTYKKEQYHWEVQFKNHTKSFSRMQSKLFTNNTRKPSDKFHCHWIPFVTFFTRLSLWV